ncbi:MAG: hypothetical protein AABX11_06410 [Nanoarchaeota archaeon]
MSTLTDTLDDRNVTSARLASLQEGETVQLANGKDKVNRYFFIGSRGSNDLRFLREGDVSDSVVCATLSPTQVLLYGDGVYRGSFIESTLVQGKDINYGEHREILRRLSA